MSWQLWTRQSSTSLRKIAITVTDLPSERLISPVPVEPLQSALSLWLLRRTNTRLRISPAGSRFAHARNPAQLIITPMTFQQLLEGAEILAQSGNPPVTGVDYDSRRVRPGTVFVAMKGESSDGNRFIDQAIAAGAVAVVRSEEHTS